MSWKSSVSACLLCVLVSPAFAAPTVSQVAGGTNASSFLDANGDWVWNIQISNTNPVPTGSAPLAAELGFTATGSALKGATNLSTGANDNFDTLNPGTIIFGWEDTVDVDPSGVTNLRPVGLQSNCAAGCTENTPGTSPNTVFSALGSIDFSTVGPHNYIQIKTKGPTSTALSSTLTVSGAYGGKGRIAELSGATAVNYDTYVDAFTRTALDGDTNLDGHRNGLDTGPFLAGFSAGVGKWFNGDYTGDGLVNGLDTGHLLSGLLAGPPASGSSVGSVPEPASLLMLALGMLGFIGRRVRK